ncbi:MAG: CoA transferase [Rubricoccaceae bacterium]|nr:CoA transferase [Rubricoccaceae bacterium]
MSAPFDGLMVLELASVLAGPSVGQFFAEGGATVLKLENPRTGGDVTRRWHLAEEAPDDDRPAYFCAANWGKRSVAVDLTTEGGRRVLHGLARRADVVVTSYRPGQAARLGADAATLRPLNRRLVVAELTGYGPDDARAGYDAVLQAEAGFTVLNGPPDGPPVKMPVALMDVLAAHQLKEAVLVALLRRERTGAGAHVAVSLLGAGAASLANQASNWLTAGVAPQRMGSNHPNIAPYGTLYPSRDGDVVLAVGTDAQFAALCDVLGLDGLPEDEAFATNAARVRHRAALNEILAAATQTWARDALLRALADRGVPAGAVRDVPAVFQQPEVARLVVRDAASGCAAVRTTAFRVDGAEPLALAPPPRFAEHTRAVLAEHLAMAADEVDALVAEGAVATREGAQSRGNPRTGRA